VMEWYIDRSGVIQYIYIWDVIDRGEVVYIYNQPHKLMPKPFSFVFSSYLAFAAAADMEEG